MNTIESVKKLLDENKDVIDKFKESGVLKKQKIRGINPNDKQFMPKSNLTKNRTRNYYLSEYITQTANK